MRRTRKGRRAARALALAPLAAVLTTTSLSSAAERDYATIEPGQARVTFGKPVVLRGQFPDAPNATIDIRHRRAGAERFALVTRARTNAEGRFEVSVRPRRTGAWRARLSDPARYYASRPDLAASDPDAATGADRIGVRSRTRADARSGHVMAGEAVRVAGRVLPGGRRRVVVSGGGRSEATRADRRGRFSVRWRAPAPGKYRLRVRARGNAAAAGSTDGAGRVIAYRRAYASWYGPGFYGNRTACGQTLTPDTIGVAHKTMPCGTRLYLRHAGRTVKVRVIDRGPYAHGREFDLTEATKRRLGFGSTGWVLASK